MHIIFFLIILLIYGQINCNKFNLDIIHTPIIDKLPIIKQHHIVILSHDDEFYTLDFSPISKSIIKRTLQLLLGKNIPAEIRLRKINILDNDTIDKKKEYKKYKLFLENYINNNFKLLNSKDYMQSKELTDITFNNIKNYDIKQFIKEYMIINQSMNLYTNNCQHFSKIVYNDYKNNYNK
jgi:hypothetical protein